MCTWLGVHLSTDLCLGPSQGLDLAGLISEVSTWLELWLLSFEGGSRLVGKDSLTLLVQAFS